MQRRSPVDRGVTCSLLALALLAASNCRRPERRATPDVFAIGVGALPGRPGYHSVVQGVELAVERLNSNSALRFRVERPRATARSAVMLAEQLRENANVIGVVGFPESGHTLETVPIFADAEHRGRDAVVLVSPTASSPQLSGVSPWFFRVAPSDNDAARQAARWAHDSLGARRAAIVYRNDSYGRDWAATFAESYVDAGGVVVSRDPYLTGVTEWDAYTAMLATSRPDLLLFPGDAGDAMAMLRAMRRAGVTIPMLGGDGIESLRDSIDAAGVRYLAFFDAKRLETPEGRDFARRYVEKYGVAPDMFAALSYDAALTIGRSVQKGATTRLAVRRAIERIGNGTAAIDGVSARIAFNTKHDLVDRTVFIATVRETAVAGTP